MKNKKILVTGAARGIGFVVAKTLAAQGAEVFICSRNAGELRAAQKEIAAVAACPVHTQVLDVSDAKAVRLWAKRLMWRHINLDALINNAGILGPVGRLDELDFEKFRQTLEINFLGAVQMAYYFLPLLKKARGQIINVSGGGAAGPFPHYSAYAASKAALVRWTENLAEELKPFKIRANAVSPGFVATSIHDGTFTAGKRARQQLAYTQQELKKGGVPPEKTAELVAFLLSDKARSINGKLLSAPWDEWKRPQFLKRAARSSHFATLRRIDEKNFFEKESA